MKYRVKRTNREFPVQGEVVERRPGFWTEYYAIKGILEPVQELQVQSPPETPKTPSKRRKRAKKQDMAK